MRSSPTRVTETTGKAFNQILAKWHRLKLPDEPFKFRLDTAMRVFQNVPSSVNTLCQNR
jgi:hypothetical protein